MASMASSSAFLDRSRQCAAAAQGYAARHERYGVASYRLVAQELTVASHLWLVQAQRRTRRLQARLPLL